MARLTGTGETDVVPHVWIGGYEPGGISAETFADNVLAFASRLDLTLVFSQWTTSEADAAALAERLELAKEAGVDVWLGTYDLREFSDEELVADEEKMAHDVERLCRMVDTYAEHYPQGKVFVWHEPPNTGKWTGETRSEQARSMVENGPAIFSRQKSAVADRHPDLDLGMMLWWPTAAPPDHTDTPVCGPLMDRLADRGSLPDFTYVDVYRYHFEWDVGHEAVNDHVAAVLENLEEHTRGRPVSFLGDLHSYPEVGPHPSTYETFPEGNRAYTPSKQALLGHLDATLSTGVEGVGWYVGKHYRSATHPRNYEPFVPNVGSVEDQSDFNSVTGSRDRFVWATLALCEAAGTLEPADRFDLWLAGHDVNFYEHAVHARAADGDWKFLGDVSGYVDGDNPYSGGGRDRVHVLHALDRDRYLADGELELRIDSREDGDGATLDGVYVVPHVDVGHYLPEPELSERVGELTDPAGATLGSVTPAAELSPGTVTRVDVAVTDPGADLSRFARPDGRAARSELARREESSAFDPWDRFDLWVHGEDLSALAVELSGVDAAERAVVTEERADGPGACVFRGLERSACFERNTAGHYLDVRLSADAPLTLRAVFAMPYHGTANFRTDAEVAAVVERDFTPGTGEGMLGTFALGRQCWPGGRDLGPDQRLELRVPVPHRAVRPSAD